MATVQRPTPALDSPLKWHGGKAYLAKQIWQIARQIPHKHRVEVYGGSLAFSLASDPHGYSEVVNDLHGDLQNFWHVLASPVLFPSFERVCQALPVSEVIWDKTADFTNFLSYFGTENQVTLARAVAFFYRCRLSMAGRMDSFTPTTRTRTRRERNEQVSAWQTTVEGLPAVHARAQRFVIRCKRGLQVLKQEDGRDTLFYLDPPYLHSTRSVTAVYDHEMTVEDHQALLEALGKIEGSFLLSGYDNPLYQDHASHRGWSRVSWNLPNNAASGPSKERKIECLWSNRPIHFDRSDI